MQDNGIKRRRPLGRSVVSLLLVLAVLVAAGFGTWYAFLREPVNQTNGNSSLPGGASTHDDDSPSRSVGGDASTNEQLAIGTFEETGRFALIVGNSKYEGAQSLRNPSNDADGVASALQLLGFEVQLLKDASKRQLKEAIHEFVRKLGTGKIGVFFYAGHGMQVQGVNYLIPLGADPQEQYDVADECLDIGYVLEAMESQSNTLNVMILDCCRNNRFKRSWTRNTDTNLAPIANVPEGTIVAFSTAPGSVADDGKGDNSPYTKHLLQALARRPREGLVLQDVFRYTAQRLKQETKQRSWANMDLSIPDFVLWKPGRAALQGAEAGDIQARNGLEMPFCWCPAGSFTMGSPDSDPDRGTDETQVDVELSGFWIGQYEVTQGEFKQVMKVTPWQGKPLVKIGERVAATFISWEAAEEFCLRFSNQERQAGRLPEDWKYALPTEAQWEYACRAGTTTPYSFGASPESLSEFAWFADNTRDSDHARVVGQKRPNPWNLYDVHGNACEWCRDCYTVRLPGGKDPFVSVRAGTRVGRGGCWSYEARFSRSSDRLFGKEVITSSTLGFRVALVNQQ